MKLYNPHTFEKLGFDVILSHLQQKLHNEESVEIAQRSGPIEDTDALLQSLQSVWEMKELLSFDDPYPSGTLPAVSHTLDKIYVEGNWLQTREFSSLQKWLNALKSARTYLKGRKDKYPALFEMLCNMPFPDALIPMIHKVIDEQGNVRDQASETLAGIRKDLARSSSELRILLNRILRKAISNNWSEDAEITFRNDRLVIPVRSDARGRVPGFIQDISQSGQTVFIEPADSLPLNNQLKELKIREQNEIIRILEALTSEIREYHPVLLEFKEVGLRMEIIYAKGKLAIEMKATLPRIFPEGDHVKIREGYNPVLKLREKKEKIKVVPLDVELVSKQRILIISGPNAGGKSVALKTIGLMQLMLQSGFLIPVDERSEFRLFSSLFLDIGDEQSMASDLSTYTSHLFQMRTMGDNMDRDSLFLIDEFGTGTDPKLGGAIAESFLERFLRQGAYGVITTHYGNLKAFAGSRKGIANAAMEFDMNALKPSFRIKTGIPGRSYAFEIAARVGVHDSILRNARTKLGEKEANTEDLLRKMEQKSAELNRLVAINQKREDKLASTLEKHDTLAAELEKNKKQIIRDAKKQASELIANANKEIERTIREIREQQAEKEATRKLRQQLKEKAPKPEPEAVRKKPGKPKLIQESILSGPIEKGDWVKLLGSQSVGQIIDIKRNKAVVELGEIRMNVKVAQLQKIQAPPEKKKSLKSSGIFNLQKLGDAQSELNVMGMRVEEVLPLIEKAVDDALFAGLKQIRILHGKGTGALRVSIRKFLSGHRGVHSYEDAHLDLGGAGWTIVSLKT